MEELVKLIGIYGSDDLEPYDGYGHPKFPNQPQKREPDYFKYSGYGLPVVIYEGYPVVMHGSPSGYVYPEIIDPSQRKDAFYFNGYGIPVIMVCGHPPYQPFPYPPSKNEVHPNPFTSSKYE